MYGLHRQKRAPKVFSSAVEVPFSVHYRITGLVLAWEFRTSRLTPADFEILRSNWHPRDLLNRTYGTHSFKFLKKNLYYDEIENML